MTIKFPVAIMENQEVEVVFVVVVVAADFTQKMERHPPTKWDGGVADPAS